jgi:hypothetical protein
MGCNCGKRTPPTGSNTPATAPTPPPVPVHTPAPATQSFVLTDGAHTQTFGSRLEADAERVRRGGGSVRPVR